MKVFITGVSGTGKTSIANTLKDKGIQAFSIDEVDGLCHWINKSDGKVVDYEAKLDKEFISSHIWVCDIEKLKKLLDNESDVVILGMAENQDEFLPLFDKIFLLQCQSDTFIKRITGRRDNVFGQDKTAQEYLLNTFREFEKSMLEKGATTINAEKPLAEVVEEVLDLLNTS